MAALDPIDDANTFPEKTEGGDVGEPTDLVAAADLNALKARISENREQANDALAEALDALYPLVQSAHTSATKTLAAGDAGDVIPLNGASNAIEVTIPHTLFAAGGTGRAWSCGFYVTSVAGGAVTFVGSGGIVIAYHGKKPSATAIAANDTIFITVVSATLAFVHISAEIP